MTLRMARVVMAGTGRVHYHGAASHTRYSGSFFGIHDYCLHVCRVIHLVQTPDCVAAHPGLPGPRGIAGDRFRGLYSPSRYRSETGPDTGRTGCAGRNIGCTFAPSRSPSAKLNRSRMLCGSCCSRIARNPKLP